MPAGAQVPAPLPAVSGGLLSDMTRVAIVCIADCGIPAWSRNISSRIGRTPKVAFVDSGIAANLLGADARSLIRPGGPFGPLLEGFVVMELARQATWSQTRVELSHYRTKDDVEVDAVLESRQGKVAGIEVTAASTVGQDDFRGLRHLAQRLGDDFVAGLVLYTGQQTLSFGPRLRAMPVSALWEVPSPEQRGTDGWIAEQPHVLL